jgi:hypothetical protein
MIMVCNNEIIWYIIDIAILVWTIKADLQQVIGSNNTSEFIVPGISGCGSAYACLKFLFDSGS